MRTFTARLARVLLFTLPIATVSIANGQCQNQYCSLASSGCWKCIDLTGSACSVPPKEKCSNSCTNTSCGCASGTATASGKCVLDTKKLAAYAHPKLTLASFNNNASTATGVIFWPGNPGDPGMLVSTTHDSVHDLLTRGTLRNESDSGITSYKIGWVIFERNGTVRSDIGPIVKVGEPVKPGDDINIPAQHVSPTIAQGADLIVFFLDEATTADGTTWNASIPDIEARFR